MRYMMLIYQGSAPLPGSDAWAALTDAERADVIAGYQLLNAQPGVTPGEQMRGPETATTVRVEAGRTLVTDGPFAEMKEALGGWFLLEADDLDAALAIAATVPAARLGGAVEVRPLAAW